jgi:hypothetical protein
MTAEMPMSRNLVRILLLAVATVVLWYLGDILLESVWFLLRLPPDSPVPPISRLLLLPVCFAVAWLLLPHRTSEER